MMAQLQLRFSVPFGKRGRPLRGAHATAVRATCVHQFLVFSAEGIFMAAFEVLLYLSSKCN